MKKYIQYLWYVTRHKFYVGRECLKRGLLVRAFTHDLSKLRPSEFKPYADYFYGKQKSKVVEHLFDLAWLYHQKRNDHHWQWWALIEDDGGTKLLPMSEDARLEMLCDWIGAGMAIAGTDDPTDWYEKNRDKMQLHPETRRWVENQLDDWRE